MANKLLFESIKYSNIFNDNFINFTKNNEIEFSNRPMSNGGIAVLYAPNGTGKSCLSEVLLNDKENTSFLANYDGKQITPEDKKFYVIKDQNSRNIIRGNASDYIVGKEIKKEFELKEKINSLFIDIYEKKISNYV